MQEFPYVFFSKSNRFMIYFMEIPISIWSSSWREILVSILDKSCQVNILVIKTIPIPL